MTIGERIKKRRTELGMSQEELAHKLGYKSRSSVNKIELGGQNLTQKKLKAIADVLDTTPEYIMGWEDEGNINYKMKFRDGMYIRLSKEVEQFLNKASQERVDQLFDYINFLILQQEKEDERE